MNKLLQNFLFAVLMAMLLAMVHGCGPSQVQVEKIQVDHGALRNANIGVLQAKNHLKAEVKPSEHVQAATMLLEPIPDELAEHQAAYDQLWSDAKENESALVTANIKIREFNHVFFSPLQIRWAWTVGVAYILIGLLYGVMKYGLSWPAAPFIALSAVAWLPILIGVGAVAHSPQRNL